MAETGAVDSTLEKAHDWAFHYGSRGRAIAAAILPPAAALVIEWMFPMPRAAWALFYPAVFLSAWFGGFASGLGATALSSLVIWWFFVSPVHVMLKAEPRSILATTIFGAIGVGLSILQRRLGKSKREIATALLNAKQLTARLEHAINERRSLAAVIENSSDLISTATLEGKVNYMNPAGRRMVGLAPDFPIETTQVINYYPARLRGFLVDVIFPETLARNYWEGEASLRHWQTEAEIPVWITAFTIRDPESKQRLGVATITRDITTLRRTRDELAQANASLSNALRDLRASANDLREAQRVAHLGSWHWDLASDTVRWSEELHHMLGTDPRRPPPRLFRADQPVFTGDSTAQLREAVQKLLHDGTPYELDVEFVPPNGAHRWFGVRGEAIRDAGGRIVAVSGTALDITRLKELQQLREEWTSIIAHDLRQPIGVISSAADFLPVLRTAPMKEQERDFTERIQAASRTLARMVDDLLDMSLLEANRLRLDRQWVDPRALVRQAVDRLTTVVAAERVDVVEEGHVERVYVDPMRFSQVLGNLISNAVKYGRPDTKVVVRLARHDGEAQLSVTNDGPGIPPDELPHLFNRFARSSSTHGTKVPGLGLGLYICKGIVEAHGGRLWAESTPGQTTTFYFTLPTKAEAAQAA